MIFLLGPTRWENLDFGYSLILSCAHNSESSPCSMLKIHVSEKGFDSY